MLEVEKYFKIYRWFTATLLAKSMPCYKWEIFPLIKWYNVNFQKVKDTSISKYHMYILNICNFSQLYLDKAEVGGVENQYVIAKN